MWVGCKWQKYPINHQITAHPAKNVNISIIIKGNVIDIVKEFTLIDPVAARPVMRPLPLALGGGGEGDEKGGEGGHEKG